MKDNASCIYLTDKTKGCLIGDRLRIPVIPATPTPKVAYTIGIDIKPQCVCAGLLPKLQIKVQDIRATDRSPRTKALLANASCG